MKALFTIAKRWKQPNVPLTDEWIHKMWYSHTVECYSTMKRSEILNNATTWMNLGDIILNGIIQSQKHKFYVIPLT